MFVQNPLHDWASLWVMQRGIHVRLPLSRLLLGLGCLAVVEGFLLGLKKFSLDRVHMKGLQRSRW